MKNYLCVAAACSLCCFCGCGKKTSVNDKLSMAVTAFHANQMDKSTSLIKEVRKQNPENVSAMLLEALQYEKKGEDEKALDLARQAAAAAPDDFIAQYTFGRLAAKEPLRNNEAFSVLEKAHRLRSQDVNTLILLCNLGTVSGNPNTAKYIEQLLSLKGGHSETLYYQFGLAKARAGKQKQALLFFKHAVKKGGFHNHNLVLNVARAVDNYHLSAKEAKYYYKYFLALPGSQNSPYRAEAQARLKVLR